MPAFDLETASASEHQFFDNVKTGVLYKRDADGVNTGTSCQLKCKKQSVASSELAAVAAELGIAPDATIITAWAVDADDEPPEAGDAIEIEDLFWLLQRVFDQETRQWQCVAANPGSREVIGRL